MADRDEVLQRVNLALRDVQAALDALQGQLGVIQCVIGQAIQQPLNAASKPVDHAAEHLRQHRPGKPSRIDTDLQLRCFILKRIDGLTFHELADAVAEHFPEARRVGKSAIHAWWQKHRQRRFRPR